MSNIKFHHNNKRKEKNFYKQQCLFTYHNINVRLFSRYDVENTQVMLVIHVWYAWLTCWLPHKSHMADSIIFKF